MNAQISIKIPHKLPLLEGLCWNIADPYSLTPKEMLSIYEERWRFLEVLGLPSHDEEIFINQLCEKYQWSPLLPTKLNMDKEEFFQQAEQILQGIDKQLLIEQQAYFGGGTMLALEQNNYRLSYDLDFICNLNRFNQLKRWFASYDPQQLFPESNFTIKDLRKDAYSIRIPIKTQPELPAVKLEFIAETRFEIERYETGKIDGLPLLNNTDRFTSKLLANADRGIDSSTYSRDLIDLAILRLSQPIPKDAIATAEANYQVVEPLIEAIEKFQNKPELRNACYTALRIDNPILIIDGLDLLAADVGLEKTRRSFSEKDYGYLEPLPKSQTIERPKDLGQQR